MLLGNPAILLFATRDAGFLVLAQLVLDSEDGRPTSFEGLSRRFAISRTHVRKMLRDAQAMGLLMLSGRGGQAITLMPAMLGGARQVRGRRHVRPRSYRGSGSCRPGDIVLTRRLIWPDRATMAP